MIGGYSPQYAFEINEPEALAQRIRDNSRPTGTVTAANDGARSIVPRGRQQTHLSAPQFSSC
jgi:hypothetical protein